MVIINCITTVLNFMHSFQACLSLAKLSLAGGHKTGRLNNNNNNNNNNNLLFVIAGSLSGSYQLSLLTHYLLQSNILYTQFTSWFLWREENRRTRSKILITHISPEPTEKVKINIVNIISLKRHQSHAVCFAWGEGLYSLCIYAKTWCIRQVKPTHAQTHNQQ
jgi:hypothetical protein